MDDASAETPSPSGTEHLDSIQVEPEAGEASTPEAGAAGVTLDGYLTPEAFAEGFALTFAMLGELSGLATLKGVPKNPTAKPAAQALYETAREVPWLQWLIRPDSKWLGRTMAIGAFAVPLALGCQRELRERAALKERLKAKASTPAAPTPPKEPPPEDMAPLQ